EVVGHLVLRRKTEGRRREGEADQAVVLRWREQPQRIPAPAPRVADARVRFQNHERQPALREAIADRQARLSAPDDDNLDALTLRTNLHIPPPKLTGSRTTRR